MASWFPPWITTGSSSSLGAPTGTQKSLGNTQVIIERKKHYYGLRLKLQSTTYGFRLKLQSTTLPPPRPAQRVSPRHPHITAHSRTGEALRMAQGGPASFLKTGFRAHRSLPALGFLREHSSTETWFGLVGIPSLRSLLPPHTSGESTMAKRNSRTCPAPPGWCCQSRVKCQARAQDSSQCQW